MEAIQGSGSGAGSTRRAGLSGEEISGIITAEVAKEIREETPELFKMVKTPMIHFFDDRYAALSEVVVVASTVVVVAVRTRGERYFQHRGFDNMKSPEFDGVSNPIVAMRRLSDVEGCFFMCSCPDDHKVRCALNLLRLGVKDWWRVVIGAYTLEQRVAVSWE